MDREIEYQQFEQGEPEGLAGEVDLRRVSEIPMELSVEIGRTQMTVGETLSLREGAVVVLDRLAGEPVDLLVNGTPIARGEVVIVDEKFGLRVKQILEGADREDGSEQQETPAAVAAQRPAQVAAQAQAAHAPAGQPAAQAQAAHAPAGQPAAQAQAAHTAAGQAAAQAQAAHAPTGQAEAAGV